MSNLRTPKGKVITGCIRICTKQVISDTRPSTEERERGWLKGFSSIKEALPEKARQEWKVGIEEGVVSVEIDSREAYVMMSRVVVDIFCIKKLSALGHKEGGAVRSMG